VLKYTACFVLIATGKKCLSKEIRSLAMVRWRGGGGDGNIIFVRMVYGAHPPTPFLGYPCWSSAADPTSMFRMKIEVKIPRFRCTCTGNMIWLAIFSSMSVPLLVIKVHIFRTISLSIARKQKKYDRITDISKTR
jgi:hypothetical protein